MLESVTQELSPAAALRVAVEKLGGQGATGRFLGISQPSVWGWLKKGRSLPAHHVLKVEEATGISRHRLRPDIYGPASDPAADRHNGAQA